MYLITWCYDRANSAHHTEIAELRHFRGDFTMDSIHYKTPQGRHWRKIDLTKIAFINIRPAPEPYLPPELGKIDNVAG